MSACYAEKQKAVRNAFCPDQCCSTLVLGHCTPVWWADILRCLCSDTTMLSACFAEQHRTVRNAFCLDQCCSALVLRHCTPIWWANTQRSICSDTTMLSACFAEKQKAVRNAFCPDQCCIALVLGHCTPVWWADILRSICNDTSGLSAYFAEQHRTVRNAFCLDQCCSALVLGHCTPIWWANTQRSICTDTTMLSACFAEKQKAVRNAFCFSDKVLQCIGDGTLYTCVFAKYPKVSFQWHYNAVSLFCIATQGSEECYLSWPVLQCIGFVLTSAAVHWWSVCLKNIQRCLCSDTTMLSTCFAEQHRAVRNAFCLDQCCSALVLGHCTPVCLKYPKVSLQWHYNAVSLVCKATQDSQECILSWPVLQCIGDGTLHTCVFENIQRCLCSDTTMLSACFAEKQKAVRNAFCFSDKVLTSVVVHWWWDTAHLCVCKISKGVFAVTLQCCQPVLQRNKRQWGMHFVSLTKSWPVL